MKQIFEIVDENESTHIPAHGKSVAASSNNAGQSIGISLIFKRKQSEW